MNGPERRAGNPAARPGQTMAVMLQQAQALLQQRKRGEAAEIYRRILKAAPDNLIALFNLGKIYHEQRELDLAAACFEQAVRRKSDEPQFKIALAFVRTDQRDLKAAIDIWNDVKGKASSPKLLVKIGTHLVILGRLDEAKGFFNEALAADPAHVPAYYGLSTVSKIGPDAPEFRSMLDLEKKAESLPPRERSTLAFTLGNAFLDQGDDENAFSRLAEANRLRRATYAGFDMAAMERYADNIVSLFDDKTARKCEGMGKVKSERPVFITGMPRSGSTLTEQILAAHPDVASLGETDAFTRAVPFYENAEMPGLFPRGVPSMTGKLLEALSPDLLYGAATTYLSLTDRQAAKAKRATDKMLFNFMWTGLIFAALPNARVIHCTRDPMDTCLSIWRMSFLQDIPWAYDMQEIGRFHRLHDRLSRHWKDIFPGRIYEAGYETTVSDQENATRALLDFCGLPWNDACLSFHNVTGRVETASASQVRQPMYKSSSGKWKKHEKHLAPLLRALEGAP